MFLHGLRYHTLGRGRLQITGARFATNAGGGGIAPTVSYCFVASCCHCVNVTTVLSQIYLVVTFWHVNLIMNETYQNHAKPLLSPTSFTFSLQQETRNCTVHTSRHSANNSPYCLHCVKPSTLEQMPFITQLHFHHAVADNCVEAVMNI